jgi:hypothetical protein
MLAGVIDPPSFLVPTIRYHTLPLQLELAISRARGHHRIIMFVHAYELVLQL